MKGNIFWGLVFIFFSFEVHSQTPQIKWWFDLLDSSFGQSAAGDIDKDGKLEVVFGCYRNDSSVYALNAENGTLLWKYNTHGAGEGCNDVPIALYEVDNDDTLEVIVPSSCNPKTYCFRGKTGVVQWQAPTAGSDSPPTLGDIDGDGKMEILHGGFDGHVMCINSENGSVAWSKEVFSNSWVQTAPTIVDLNNDGQLDFVVGTWAFAPDTNRIYAYTANTQNLLWSKPVFNHIYHGTAVADFDHDNKPELVVGDYSGKLFALNGEDGSTVWEYQANVYIGAPATIADLNNDGDCEIIFCDGYGVGVLSKAGILIWYYTIPGVAQSFRGVAVADINGDNALDIVFGTNKGHLLALNGNSGTLIWDLDLGAHLGKSFDINHAPLIADFDQDGQIDVFVVGGKTDYPNFQTNYGRAYMISVGTGSGPEWLMFQHDLRRKSSMCDAPVSIPFLDIQNEQIQVFPNPASTSIQILHCQPNTSKELYNSVGQLLFATKENEIGVSRYASGVYYLKCGNRVVKISIE